jgi:hypothetical protein
VHLAATQIAIGTIPWEINIAAVSGALFVPAIFAADQTAYIEPNRSAFPLAGLNDLHHRGSC